MKYVSLLVILIRAAHWDIRERRIPNGLLITAVFLRILLFGGEYLIKGSRDLEEFLSALLGMLIFWAVFLLLTRVLGKPAGFGDAKLMGVEIFYCGWELAFRGIFYGLLLAALLSLGLMLLKKRRLKDTLPLAPYLLAGYCVTFFI